MYIHKVKWNGTWKVETEKQKKADNLSVSAKAKKQRSQGIVAPSTLIERLGGETKQNNSNWLTTH